jgi:hypothetical protein
MKRLLVGCVLFLLSLAFMRGWWTLRAKGKQARNLIPAKILDGDQSLEIDTASSTAATLRVSLKQRDQPTGQQILLNAYQKVPAGSRSWMIDIPAGVGGNIKLEADEPKPGDTLSMRVHVNGSLVDEQTDALNQPLLPDTAFFLQDHFDDYSKAGALGQP